MGSNHRHREVQSRALPAELNCHMAKAKGTYVYYYAQFSSGHSASASVTGAFSISVSG